jgi:hypothetical protein
MNLLILQRFFSFDYSRRWVNVIQIVGTLLVQALELVAAGVWLFV